MNAVGVFESARLPEEARRWGERSVEVARKAFPETHFAIPYALSEFSYTLIVNREYDLAISSAEESLALYAKHGGPGAIKEQAQEALKIAKARKAAESQND